MYALYQDKVYTVLKSKRTKVLLKRGLRKKEIIDVPKSDVIPIPDDALQLQEKMMVRWNKHQYQILKLKRTNADIALICNTDKQRQQYKNAKQFKRNRSSNGKWYYDIQTVPIKDLVPWDIKQLGYKYFLLKLLNIVIDEHQDLIDRCFNQKSKKLLAQKRIKLGKRSYRRAGSCQYRTGLITINPSNSKYDSAQEDLLSRPEWWFFVIWHEILHMQYHGHLNGHFHHYESLLRKQQCMDRLQEAFEW